MSIFKDRVTVGSAREQLRPMLQRLEQRIDAAVRENSSKSLNTLTDQSPPIQLRVESLENSPVSRQRCGTLYIQQDGVWSQKCLGVRLLFYLVSLGRHGSKRQIGDSAYLALSIDELSKHYTAWHPNRCRNSADQKSLSAKGWIQQEWPQFIQQMSRHLNRKDAFPRSWRDPATSKTFYLANAEIVRISVEMTQLDIESICAKIARFT